MPTPRLMHHLRRLIAVTAALAPLLGIAQPASALPLKLFPLPYPENCARPPFVFGPEDSLWFALEDCEEHLDVESYWSAIGRLPLDDPRPQIVRRLDQDPVDLTVGPEGNLWFTERTFADSTAGEVPHIGRMTVSGQLTQFPTPVQPDLRYTLHEQPGQILPGPENDLWFVAEGLGSNVLARITPSGVSSLFPAQQIPNGRHELEAKADEVPRALAKAADGNLWMGEQFMAGMVGLVQAGGAIKQISVGERGQGVLNSGRPMIGTPDGGLWFLEEQGFAQLGPEGAVLSRVHAPGGGTSFTGSMATTGDDILWVADREVGEVLERVTSAGGLGEVVFCSSNETPEQIVVGPEGDLWFTPRTGKGFGRLALAQLTHELEGERLQARICGAQATARMLRARLAFSTLNAANSVGYQAKVSLVGDPSRVLGVRRFVTKADDSVLVLRVPLRPGVRALLYRRGRLRLRLTLRSGARVVASRVVVLHG